MNSRTLTIYLRLTQLLKAPMNSVLIAGGSGLIGSFLLQLLLDDETIMTIYYVGRKAPDIRSEKISFLGFNELANAGIEDPSLSSAFCCLGTTIKKAGSKEAFEAVDLNLVKSVAGALSKAVGFYVVSSLGADKNSRVFYSSVKGRMEESLRQMGFKKLVIFRPSILTGPRSEFRLGERIGIVLMSLLSPLMIGKLRKYRPIKAETVARAMYQSSYRESEACRVVEGDEIRTTASL